MSGAAPGVKKRFSGYLSWSSPVLRQPLPPVVVGKKLDFLKGGAIESRPQYLKE
jgi:hypothetical protein